MTTHPFFRRAIPAIFLLSTSLFSQPAERPKAEAMVKEGVAFLKAKGKDAFVAEVQKPDGRFHLKPGSTLYLMVHDVNCLVVAHGANPASTGLNRFNVKDPDGKYLVREMVKAGQQKGGGWVDYKWPNPTNNRVEDKSTFSLAEGNLIVGCGIYK
jgi:signal transduction histidine kinase